MQRVKDNPINNRLIQLYINIFPKIEDFNMEIFYEEILVLKKSPILKRHSCLKIIACHTLWKRLLLS